MPLKMGKDHATISQNIKELVRSGHEPEEAVAIAMAHSRKPMSDGGMVGDDSDESVRDLAELNADGDMNPSSVASPEEATEESRFADALREKAKSYLPGYSEGGMVKEIDAPSPVSAEKPMVSELTEEARMALEDKKKKRRYGQS